MTTRRQMLSASLAAGAALALPARFARASSKIQIGSVLAGTTIAAELMPKYLKEAGIDAEVLSFPNITQRMQALASGDVQIGYGSVNGAILLASRGLKLSILANACEGGGLMVGKPEIKGLADLKGRKVAVQPGSLTQAALQWKLKSLGLTDAVELLFLDVNNMPVALQKGQVDAILPFEPYATLARMNGFGHDIWYPYDTPMGRTNVVFVASSDFVAREPALAREVVRAHVRATQELQKDNSAAVDAIVKSLNLPREVAIESLKNTFFVPDTTEKFEKSIIAVGQTMLETGMVTRLPDWSTFIDRRYV